MSHDDGTFRPGDPPEAVHRHPDDGWVRATPRVLNPFAEAALGALTVALTPPPPAPQLPDIKPRVSLFVRSWMPYLSAGGALGLAVFLTLLEFAPLWTLRGWRRLSKQPPETVRGVVDLLAHTRWLGPLRDGAMGVRGLVQGAYYDQPEVQRAMGYEPEPFIAERITLRRRLLAGEDATPGDMLAPLAADRAHVATPPDAPIAPDATSSAQTIRPTAPRGHHEEAA